MLDTHYVVWATVLGDRLTPAESGLIEGSEILVSAISLWELRIKWNLRDSRGNRRGPADPVKILQNLKLLGIEAASLTPDQAAAPLRHPVAHKDPFDQALLIHAQELDAKLLTRDRELARHPLAITA